MSTPKPFHERLAAVRAAHGDLAASIFRAIPVNARQLHKEDQAEADHEARREARQRELLASDKYAELAKVARHGGQALSLALSHRPEIRDLHRELTHELDALDSEPEPPDAAA